MGAGPGGGPDIGGTRARRRRLWRFVVLSAALALAGFATATVAFAHDGAPRWWHPHHRHHQHHHHHHGGTTTGETTTGDTTTTGGTTTEETTTEETTTGDTTTEETTTEETTTAGTTTTATTAAAPRLAPPRADVSVSVTAPLVARVGKPLTFAATVTNGGPDTATGVIVKTAVPAGAALVSVASSVGNGCVGGATPTCYVGTLAAGASANVTVVLSTQQEGPLTVAPAAEGDYDTNPANNSGSATVTVVSATAPPPPPPPPTQPGTFNAIGSGTVTVNGVVQPADELFLLESGDVVDVTDGVITFTASDGSYGSFSSSQFVVARRTSSRAAATANVPARFRVDQTAGEPTTLTLVGGDFSTCTSPRSVAAASQKPVRQLWGSAKGRFQTHGQYAVATVRGTVWLTQDRCDGTYTQVVESIVDILDLTLQKTVALGPGQSYLALPKRAPFKPPAARAPSGRTQSAAQIRAQGLKWGGRRFATRAAFASWLSDRGASWARFAGGFPAQAAALASRR